MLQSIAVFAAGIALVWLSILTAAAGFFVMLTYYRERTQALTIKQAKDNLDLQKLESMNRIISVTFSRIETIADRLAEVSSEAFIAEIDAVYQKAEVVEPATAAQIRAATPSVSASFIGDA